MSGSGLTRDEKESREFMAGVWNKVRYYEYCRAEEEKIRRNEKAVFLHRLKMALMTLAAVLACVLPVLIITGFGMYFILYAGVILMSAVAVYESVAESSFAERSRRRGY